MKDGTRKRIATTAAASALGLAMSATGWRVGQGNERRARERYLCRQCAHYEWSGMVALKLVPQLAAGLNDYSVARVPHAEPLQTDDHCFSGR